MDLCFYILLYVCNRDSYTNFTRKKHIKSKKNCNSLRLCVWLQIILSVIPSFPILKDSWLA